MFIEYNIFIHHLFTWSQKHQTLTKCTSTNRQTLSTLLQYSQTKSLQSLSKIMLTGPSIIKNTLKVIKQKRYTEKWNYLMSTLLFLRHSFSVMKKIWKRNKIRWKNKNSMNLGLLLKIIIYHVIRLKEKERLVPF